MNMKDYFDSLENLLPMFGEDMNEFIVNIYDMLNYGIKLEADRIYIGHKGVIWYKANTVIGRERLKTPLEYVLIFSHAYQKRVAKYLAAVEVILEKDPTLRQFIEIKKSDEGVYINMS